MILFITGINRFKPALPDDEIKSMIETPKEKLIECQNAIYNVGYVGNENSSSLASLKKSINKALAQTEEHLIFVKNYLSKSNMPEKQCLLKQSGIDFKLN